MKRITLIISLALIIISCENDQYVRDSDIPAWLKERIASDEEIIAENPQSGLDIAAWIRYKYNESYYFEYLNLLSSSYHPVYNHQGEIIADIDEYQKYSSRKCCKQFVWKGSAYIEFD